MYVFKVKWLEIQVVVRAVCRCRVHGRLHFCVDDALHQLLQLDVGGDELFQVLTGHTIVHDLHLRFEAGEEVAKAVGGGRRRLSSRLSRKGGSGCR